METARTALEQAYLDYRTELETAEKKSRPTDGLFGIGRTIGDDACHEHFDARVRQAAESAAEGKPSGDEAREAVRTLLLWEGDAPWPLSAQWMLRAAERHSLPLIPLLRPEDAEDILKAYGSRYPRWDRLPAQKQVFAALKAKTKAAGTDVTQTPTGPER